MIAFWMVMVLLAVCVVVIVICSRIPDQGFEYGVIEGRSIPPCRRDRNTGRVEFLLWKAGEHGHTEDYWYELNSFWWDAFVPYGK